MPIFMVTAPDGRKLKVTAPEGATQEQAIEYARNQMGKKPEADPMLDRSHITGSAGQQMLAGAGKFFTDVALGTRQMVGAADGADAQSKRAADAELMESPYAKTGAIGAGVVSAIPTLAIPGANTIVGASAVGAGMGAVQPAESLGERAANVGIGAGLGAAGQYGGAKLAGYAGKQIAARGTAAQSAQAGNAVRDATVRNAQAAGYVVPPSTANPSLLNRAIESVSGKAATQQAASVKNQQVTNDLIRQEFGLAPDAPLTKQTFEVIRKEAGKVYGEISKSGTIKADVDFLDAIRAIRGSTKEINKSFPGADVGAAKEISKLSRSLIRDKFDAGAAMEYIKQLRKQASSNLSPLARANPNSMALGKAQRDAADALEGAVMRHLNATGKADLAQSFDAARKTIAKSYSAENALNEATGNIVARNLKNQLGRGKPLSGNMKQIAQFAQAFPKAADEMTASPGVSALDAMVGVGGVTLDPRLLAMPISRQIARAGVLSPAYQRAMVSPSYSPRSMDLLAMGQAGKFAPPGLPAGALGLLGIEPIEQ